MPEVAEPDESWVLLGEEGLEISPQDDRKHHLLTLPNGLVALVTSDPTSEKAAAALAVMVGSMADPPELPGLAHFCEHMCFLGSQKYPEENAYKKYLSAHAGKANASTSGDRTVFEFDVATAHLEGALDLFAQFFIAPLFAQDATERELKAVDSEDAKNRTNDGRRLLQVLRALARPSHAFAKFSTGNLKTLREDVPPELDVREALLAFHARYYTASRMRLCVCGREPLAELERWVREKFDAVPTEPRQLPNLGPVAVAAVEAGALAPPEPGPPPLHLPLADPMDGARPALVEVAPLRELRDVQLMWTLPSLRQLYRADAARLFGHLLGHEGEGSVFARLQDQGWATALSAGTGHEDDNFTFFQVKVTLTPAGEANLPHIVALILQCCRLLQRMDASEVARHWAEVRAVSSLRFRFQQRPQPYDFVQTTARRLTVLDPKHVLSAGGVYEDLDPAVVTCLAQRLTLENLVVRVVSQQLSGAAFTDEERWYKVPFSRRPLPEDFLAACSGTGYSVRLPAPNEYIPDDLSLKGSVREPRLDSPVTAPMKLAEDERGRLWHKADERYAQPRIELHLLLRSPAVKPQLTYGHLLCSYMTSRLKQATYAATIAGLSWSISHGVHGLHLSVSGYSQRAPRLLDHVLITLLSGPWTDEDLEAQALRFEAVRERIERLHRSWDKERPDAHAAYWVDILLSPEGRTIAEKLVSIREATLDRLKSFHLHFMQGQVFAECFVCGNASVAEAQELYGTALERLRQHSVLPLPREEFPEMPLNELRWGDRFELHGPVANPQEQNSAVYAFFQAGELQPARQAALRMITQVMREPCFNELRTQQQIGYVVSSSHEVDYAGIRKIEGLSVTVLSNRLSAVEVLRRIDEFLAGFRSKLAELSDADWAFHADALKTRLLDPPKKLGEEASRHWAQIRHGTLDWFWRERIVEALAVLLRAEASQLLEEMLLPGSSRRVSALMFGVAFPLEPGQSAAVPGASAMHVTEPAFEELRALLPRFSQGVASSL